MAYSDLRNCIDIRKTADIHLEHFGSNETFLGSSTDMLIGGNDMNQRFIVEVYANGIVPESRGYVSVVVRKIFKVPIAQPSFCKNSLSWTFSIVDVNGAGRYYQSFCKENVVDQEYAVDVPNFLKRSVILEQSDEFLPDDVLTVRCELSCMSYTGPDYCDMWHNEIFSHHNTINLRSKNFGRVSYYGKTCTESGYTFKIEHDLEELIDDLQNIVILILEARSYHPHSLKLQKEWLQLTLTDDEIKNTYLGSNPLFKAYMLLKEKLKKTINHPIPLSLLHGYDQHLMNMLCSQVGRDNISETSTIRLAVAAQDENNPLSACWSWSIEIEKKTLNHQALSELDGECSLESRQQKEGIIKGADKISVKTIDGAVEQAPSADISIINTKPGREMNECPEERNDGHKIENSMHSNAPTEYDIRIFKEFTESLKETIKYLLSEEMELQDDGYRCLEHNFVVETVEGETFAIPFKDGRETIGSKLIAASPVFERMLATPMQEKHLKRVKLLDVGRRTFVNFLLFLHAGKRQFEPLCQLWELYEMADKYDVPDLMRSCADEMAFYFVLENIKGFEALARQHADNYLLEMVNYFIKCNIIVEPPAADVNQNLE